MLYGTLLEYVLHRFLLHRFSRNLKIQFHSDHHVETVKTGGYDRDYMMPVWKMFIKHREFMFVGAITLLHVPLAFFSPMFYIGNCIVAITYFVTHILSHRYPELGWRWLPWHMEHHLVSGSKNYGVVVPLWDYVFGTLQTSKKYAKGPKLNRKAE